jgi:hypothetical protein
MVCYMNGVANHLGWVKKKLFYMIIPITTKGLSVPAEPGRTVLLLKSNAVTPLLLHDQLLRLICF